MGEKMETPDVVSYGGQSGGGVARAQGSEGRQNLKFLTRVGAMYCQSSAFTRFGLGGRRTQTA